jgi:hypothetical protein
MEKEDFWVKPGVGYSPLYSATMWSIVLLAQLGATIDINERIATAYAYVPDHGLTKHGQFAASSSPSGTQDCFQGILCYALRELGCQDPRLDAAYEYMTRSITGESIAPATDRAR